jgi:regulator of protease activity HflC (stomatin/prohibitin superfamily)
MAPLAGEGGALLEAFLIGAAGVLGVGGLRLKVVQQIERAVVFRFGRALPRPRQPGLTALIPSWTR